MHGNSDDHLVHRTQVVCYMRQHRDDFEPFVEDDLTFDQHLSSLAENGTFAGNDSIVAFARKHNLTVVIHQLNKPLWQIHGGNISIRCPRKMSPNEIGSLISSWTRDTFYNSGYLNCCLVYPILGFCS